MGQPNIHYDAIWSVLRYLLDNISVFFILSLKDVLGVIPTVSRVSLTDIWAVRIITLYTAQHAHLYSQGRLSLFTFRKNY